MPPSGIQTPRPTCSLIVATDDSPVPSIELEGGVVSPTAITPQISAALMAVGRRMRIGYSGDSDYEASAGIS